MIKNKNEYLLNLSQNYIESRETEEVLTESKDKIKREKVKQILENIQQDLLPKIDNKKTKPT